MPEAVLHPFPGQPRAGFSLHCAVERPGQAILLSFTLQGELDRLLLPRQGERHRADNLWQATCFEMFWAEEGKERYRELNLSPAGGWNVYAFSGYRRDMRPEEGLAAPFCRCRRDGDRFHLDARLDIATLHQGRPPLRVGLAAVLKDTENNLTCWALAHPGPRPDFHARAGFCLRLA